MADRTVNVKLRADVAQYMSSMRAAGGATRDLEKAARDVRKAHDEEATAAGRVRVAEAKLNDLRADSKTKVSQLAAAEEQLAKAHRSLEVAQDNTSAATARFTKAQAAAGEAAGQGVGQGMAKGIDGSAGDVDKAAERMAKRTNSQFDALRFTGLSVGLPAAAAVGVAGAGLALAGMPALFLGIGVAAVASNDRVQGSFRALSTTVVSDTQAMATVLAGPVASAADDLRATFVRLEPQISAAFNGSVPAVKTLTGAVTDFAQNAMPGLVVAVNSSNAPLQGLRSIAAQAGSGVTDLFTNLSKGSDAAGRSMVTVGGIIRDLEAFVGTLLANLANGSGGPLLAFQAALRQVESALLALTSNGSGAIGFLTGFTGAGVGALSVINLLAHALSALPSGVTQLAGSVTAATMILSRFGVDVGAGFRGLGDSVRNAGTDLTGVAKAGAKAGAALGGLVGAALNPATLAVAALGVGLSLLGQRQQDAAAAAAAHRSRVDSLAAALRESNGVLDANVRASAAKELADFKVSDGTRNLLADTRKLLGPGALPTLNDAYLGNAAAQKTLVSQLDSTIAEHTHLASGVEVLGTKFGDMKVNADGTVSVLDGTAKAARDLKNEVSDGSSTFGEATQKLNDQAAAAASVQRPMTELDSAMSTLKGTASDAAMKVTALKTALDILSGRVPTFEEGIQAGNDQLRSFMDGLAGGVKKADGFGQALLNVDGTVNTVTKNGSGLQDLAEGLQTSFTNAASGIDEMVRRGVPFDQATKRVNDGLAEQRDRFVSVAEKMGLSATQASALADKYGLIPTTISTLVTADTKQGLDAINALPRYAAGVAGAVVISADTNPATGQIQATVRYADGSTGVVTIAGNRNPATGQIMTAVTMANGSVGTMTVAAAIQAAKDGTLQAVHYADGSVGFIQVRADTSAAINAINEASRPRWSTITYTTNEVSAIGGKQIRSSMKNAVGNVLVPFAEGGIAAYAAGGIRPMAGGIATKVAPGDLRIIGDNMTSTEYYIPANGSARSRSLLAEANADPAFGAVQQSIQAGAAVMGAPATASQAPSGGFQGGGTEVRVFVGDREITDIVRTEIRQSNRDTRRAVTAGAGAAR